MTRTLLAYTLVALAGCSQSQDLGLASGADMKQPTTTNPDAAMPPSTPGHAVLFGGAGPTTASSSTGIYDDTWTFDGTKWTQQTVTGPSARTAAASGTIGSTVVLFGGAHGDGSYANDTWTWNGSAWAQVAAMGPSARSDSAITSLGSSLLLYGGDTNNPSTPQNSDTWLWNGTTWAQQDVSGPNTSDGWAGATLNGTPYLFNGNIVYSWNGSGWTGKQFDGGPQNDGYASVATLGNQIVYFGGSDASDFAPSADTWTFDGTNFTLRSVPGPSGRTNAGLVLVGDRLILFGGDATINGIDQPPQYYDDTWAWDGSSWTQLQIAGPSARVPGIMASY